MKVILLQDIPKVGNKYDVKDFSEGYAQNVLLSKGLAVLATRAELQKLDDRKKQMAKRRDEEMQEFMNLISAVNNTRITIREKANEKGHLFKAVSSHDVSQKIKEITGVSIDENTIVMDHIKTLGTHKVFIKKGDKKGECEIVIEAK